MRSELRGWNKDEVNQECIVADHNEYLQFQQCSFQPFRCFEEAAHTLSTRFATHFSECASLYVHIYGTGHVNCFELAEEDLLEGQFSCGA